MDTYCGKRNQEIIAVIIDGDRARMCQVMQDGDRVCCHALDMDSRYVHVRDTGNELTIGADLQGRQAEISEYFYDDKMTLAPDEVKEMVANLAMIDDLRDIDVSVLVQSYRGDATDKMRPL